MRSLRRFLLSAGVAAVVLASSACGDGRSGTYEVAIDETASTVPGPRPTAPVPSEEPGQNANAFLVQVEQLSSSNDICGVLTGEVFEQIADMNFNLSGLAANPAGVTRLFVAVDDLFRHIVAISPEDLKPHTQGLSDMWMRVVKIDASQPDYEDQVLVIVTEPGVAASLTGVGEWTEAACDVESTT